MYHLKATLKPFFVAFFKNRRLAVVAQKACILQFRYDLGICLSNYQYQKSFRYVIYLVSCDKSLNVIKKSEGNSIYLN